MLRRLPVSQVMNIQGFLMRKHPLRAAPVKKKELIDETVFCDIDSMPRSLKSLLPDIPVKLVL